MMIKHMVAEVLVRVGEIRHNQGSDCGTDEWNLE